MNKEAGSQNTMNRRSGERGKGRNIFADSPIRRFTDSFTILLLLTIAAGCGISKDVYQKSVEESEARKGELEQAHNEIARIGEENRNLKNRIDELSKNIEELASEKEAALHKLNQQIDSQSAELDVLRKEKEEFANKAEYLNSEVERLKVKAGEISSEKEKELASIKEAYESLMKEMKQEIDMGDIKITQALDRLSVNMVEKILFDSGKAEIKPEGLKVIERVGKILKGITDKQIRIEGYTDNVKIGAKIREKYPTNWELSTARATNVVRYLQDKVGIVPKFLSAAGYGEYKPIASNDTAEGRAQNRRMEIVLLPLDVGSVLEELKKK